MIYIIRLQKAKLYRVAKTLEIEVNDYLIT